MEFAKPHCKSCGDGVSLRHIDVWCSLCGRPLFGRVSVWFTAIVVICALFGVLAAVSHGAIAGLLVAFGTSTYVALLLRNDFEAASATTLIAFALLYGLAVSMQTAGLLPVLTTNVGSLQLSTVLAAIACVYLFIQLVAVWHIMCGRNRVSWFKGLPALSATILLISIGWMWLTGSTPILLQPVAGALHTVGAVRAVIWGIVGVHILLLASIAVLLRGVAVAQRLFADTDTKASPPILELHQNGLVNAITALNQTALNIAYFVYRTVATLAKVLLNIFWVSMVTILRLVRTLGEEIVAVIRIELNVFLQALVAFVRWHLLPIAIAVVIALGAVGFAEATVLHIASGDGFATLFRTLWPLLLVCAAITAFVWLEADIDAPGTVLSTVVSHVWILFSLLCAVATANLVLFVISRAVYTMPPFDRLGLFFYSVLGLVATVMTAVSGKQLLSRRALP